MSRTTTAAARRYARALLELALESGDPAEVRADLEGALGALESHAELRQALTHPALGGERRGSLARSVFEGRTRSVLVPRLLALLAERGRLDQLGAVAQAYATAWNARRGVAAAEAEAATRLDEGQRAALQRALELAAGGPVELSVRERPELLGGLRVVMGGQVYDGTVRARLRALKAALSGQARA